MPKVREFSVAPSCMSKTLRDISQPHGALGLRLAMISDRYCRGIAGVVVGVDLPAPIAQIDVALGGIGIGVGNRRRDVLQADAILRQGQRVQISTRTAGSALPLTLTDPTPGICDDAL
jgi:hypothetical protein